MKFTELKPLVYNIVKDKDSLKLVMVKDRYIVDTVTFGKINRFLPRIKQLINRGLSKNISLIADGLKGLGKSTAVYMVANELLDSGIPIIEISRIKVDLKLVNFIADFRNVAIFIDEYEKTVPSEMQSNMLTLFNDVENYTNNWLISGNDVNRISNYLIDRMERITYRLHYSKLTDEEISSYCDHMGNSENIKESLLKINKTSNKISYDTLKYVTREHKLFPEMEFSELVEFLNVQGVLGVPVLRLKSVYIDSDAKYIKSSIAPNGDLKVSELMRGRDFSVDVTIGDVEKDKEEESEVDKRDNLSPFGRNTPDFNIRVYVTMNDLESKDDEMNTYTFTKKQGIHNYTVVLETHIVSQMDSGYSGGRFF